MSDSLFDKIKDTFSADSTDEEGTAEEQAVPEVNGQETAGLSGTIEA